MPEVRLVVRTFDGDRVIDDRWLALPCDLAPGATTEIAFPRIPGELRFETAIQDVPSV
jgi:hypothetical protein